MARNRLDWRTIVVESLLIVFTVLLALALNEWRQNSKQEDQKQMVISNIISEIKENRKSLEGVIDYHRETSEKFAQYLDSDSLWNTLPSSNGIVKVIPILTRGIYPAQLEDGAWRGAEITGIAQSFEFSLLNQLSNLYSIQELGPQSTWRSMAQLFSDLDSYIPGQERELATMLQLAFRELYAQERSLMDYYDNFLSKYDK